MIIFWSKKSNGGYGDRLVGIASCIALANVIGHQFRVIWDEDLSNVFSDYQSSKPLPKSDYHYKWIDERWIQSSILMTMDFIQWKDQIILIETNQPIHYYLWYNQSLKLDRSYAEITRWAYQQIYSTYLIIKHPKKFIKLNVNSCVGLQLRFGDYYLTGNQNCHYITPKRFQNLQMTLNNLYVSNLPIYVTTDNSKALKVLKSQFVNLQSYQTSKSTHFDGSNKSLALAQIIREHVTLSQTSAILTSLTSNFGVTAGLIGGIQDIKFYHLDSHDHYQIEICDFVNYPRVKTQIPIEIYELPENLYPIATPIKTIYLVCSSESYCYYENYCQSLQSHMRCIIIKMTSDTSLDLDLTCVYLFMNQIPTSILTQIQSNLNLRHCVYLVNTEQLTRQGHYQQIQKVLFEDHLKVIDYDYYQSLMMGSPHHYYLPYQMSVSEWIGLRQLIKTISKDYDCVFCDVGASKRRQHIYQTLIACGLTVLDVKGWGDVRDRQIARAKVLINVHYDVDYQIYEHMRCDRWLLAGQMVVTESSLSDIYLDIKDLLVIAPYETLYQSVLKIVKDYDNCQNQFNIKLENQLSSISNCRTQQLSLLIDNI